jgi:hypothetical protein
VVLETALQLARKAAPGWCCITARRNPWPPTRSRFQANLRAVEILLVDGDGRVHHIETSGKPPPARTVALV